MTALAAAEAAWHYRLINACIAALSIRRENPAPEPGSLKDTVPGYHAIGLKAAPTCFLGGDRDINAGFLGETRDDYLVLALRGTITSADNPDPRAVCLDWTQDRLYDPTPWPPSGPATYGNTCQGFSAALSSLWNDIEAALNNINLDRKQGIWITGHSKGGAMAALAATLFQSRITQARHLPKVVTFGAPMVGDEVFLQRYTEVGLMEKTKRYINQFDGVAAAPSVPTPPMPIPNCPGVQGWVLARQDYHPLGEDRYISRDLIGRYTIEVGGDADKHYRDSVGVAIADMALVGPAHNPINNYLNCFRLADA